MFYICDNRPSGRVYYTPRGTWVFPIRLDTATKYADHKAAEETVANLKKQRIALGRDDWRGLEVVDA